MAWYFEGVPLFFLLYYQGSANHLRGGRDVEQKGFSLSGRNKDWDLCQELLNHVKCFLGLGCPFEVIGLLQKSIKGETSFAEA